MQDAFTQLSAACVQRLVGGKNKALEVKVNITFMKKNNLTFTHYIVGLLR
jgi:hypothetical protein